MNYYRFKWIRYRNIFEKPTKIVSLRHKANEKSSLVAAPDESLT